MKLASMAIVCSIAFLAGCGGGSDEATEPLPDGMYEYALPYDYLVENGISEDQAKNESGAHTVTLDGGEFVDRWRNDEGRTGACSGTYETDGRRVTFGWASGCYGDWEMSYSLDGDQVTWSDIEALPPYDSEQDQKVAEVFNGVPWTRVGDAS